MTINDLGGGQRKSKKKIGGLLHMAIPWKKSRGLAREKCLYVRGSQDKKLISKIYKVNYNMNAVGEPAQDHGTLKTYFLSQLSDSGF